MSLEQARGNPIDKRAGIWGFGVILVKMLTWRPSFAGDSVTAIMAAVVKSEPAWDALPSQTPANLRSIVRLCLQKDT